MSTPTATISAITARYRRGDSIAEDIEQCLQRIDRHNPSLNALCYVARDSARARARTIESQRRAAGRLLGIPFTVKETIDVAGMPRSDGSKSSYESSSRRTARMVEILEAEGAICMGKGNMAEQGRSYFTDSPLNGRSVNPWNKNRTPGGSGGGDAAAVAAQFAQFAIGADAGGSVRIPANFCGLFGLYPTPGSIPTVGLTSATHTWKQLLRSHGPMARYLEDLRVLSRILFRYEATDPFSVQRRPLLIGAPKKRLALVTAVRGVKPHAEIHSALQSIGQRFVDAGWQVEERNFAAFEGTFEPFIILAGQAALQIDDMLAADSGTPRDLSTEGPAMQRLRSRITENLPALNTETFFRAWNACHMLRYQSAQIFTDFDCVLAPVAATLAMPHGTSSFDINGVQYQSEQVFQTASMVNLLGLCALAFPTGFSAEGLPVGLQLIGNRFSEEILFDALDEIGITSMPRVPHL